MNNKSVMLQWGLSKEDNTTISITKVDVPEGLNRLLIGRTSAGETFGSGYELFLTDEEMERLSKAIVGYYTI